MVRSKVKLDRRVYLKSSKQRAGSVRGGRLSSRRKLDRTASVSVISKRRIWETVCNLETKIKNCLTGLKAFIITPSRNPNFSRRRASRRVVCTVSVRQHGPP